MKNLRNICETPEGIVECVNIAMADLLIRILVEIPVMALEQFGPSSKISIIQSPRLEFIFF